MQQITLKIIIADIQCLLCIGHYFECFVFIYTFIVQQCYDEDTKLVLFYMIGAQRSENYCAGATRVNTGRARLKAQAGWLQGPHPLTLFTQPPVLILTLLCLCVAVLAFSHSSAELVTCSLIRLPPMGSALYFSSFQVFKISPISLTFHLLQSAFLCL